MITREERAHAYQRKKKQLTLFNLFFTPFLLALLLFTRWTFAMSDLAMQWGGDQAWKVVAVYFSLFSLYFMIFDLPVAFYSGFILEHQFELSNQSLRQWVVDFLKRSGLSFFLSLILLEILYWIIRLDPDRWWVWAWAVYAGVSYVLGKIFPVFIVPLFYKYGRLEDKILEDRILKLAARFGLPVQNVYSLDLSKTTKKANAAFMGIGKTKRVVLSDTLISNFTHDEIEMVLAHELGHFKNHDVWRLLGFGLTVSFVAFAVGFWGMKNWAVALGLGNASEVAGLPLLLLLFFLVNLVLMPLQNGYSRRRERAADLFALQAVRNKDIFISCMKKLGDQNLADPEPSAWYEWFFYDHPALRKRITMAEKFIG